MDKSQISGMCIPYSVQNVPGKGRGIFAEVAIRKGTTVWRHLEGQYAVYDERSLNDLLSSMSDSEAVYVLEHIFCMPEFPDYMIRVFDDGELTNHSDSPTLSTHTRQNYDGASAITSAKDVARALLGDHFTLVAARDIQEREELTLDYNEEPDNPSYYDALCEKYGVTEDWLQICQPSNGRLTNACSRTGLRPAADARRYTLRK